MPAVQCVVNVIDIVPQFKMLRNDGQHSQISLGELPLLPLGRLSSETQVLGEILRPPLHLARLNAYEPGDF
jgi:hypothetical protein